MDFQCWILLKEFWYCFVLEIVNLVAQYLVCVINFCQIPELPAGTVVIMDNAKYHGDEDFLQVLCDNQLIPYFLPAYRSKRVHVSHVFPSIQSFFF
jgi:hypothetical protein